MAKTTGLESIAEGSSKVFMVDPRKIKVRPNWNFRNFDDKENAEHVESLYQSIKQVGVKEALTVTWDKGELWLDNGECRLRAAMLVIERDKPDTFRVPVKSEDRYANEQDRLINQRVRNAGKPFSVFEDAALFKKLVDMGMTQQEIAAKCSISAARVSQILDHNLVGKVGRQLVAEGKASATMVMQVTKAEGTNAEKALLDGMKTAKANGHEKLKPADVSGARQNISTIVRDAFEYSDVDTSDTQNVVIKMPMEQWDKLRDAAKL